MTLESKKKFMEELNKKKNKGFKVKDVGKVSVEKPEKDKKAIKKGRKIIKKKEGIIKKIKKAVKKIIK